MDWKAYRASCNYTGRHPMQAGSGLDNRAYFCTELDSAEGRGDLMYLYLNLARFGDKVTGPTTHHGNT